MQVACTELVCVCEGPMRPGFLKPKARTRTAAPVLTCPRALEKAASFKVCDVSTPTAQRQDSTSSHSIQSNAAHGPCSAGDQEPNPRNRTLCRLFQFKGEN